MKVWMHLAFMHIISMLPLFTFGRPFGGPVLSLHVFAPLPVPCGPPAEVQRTVKEICHPGKPLWGSACSNCEASIRCQTQFTAWFWVSPCAHAGPKADAVDNEKSSLSGELVRVQHALILLPDPCHLALGGHLSAHVQIVTCQVSTCHVVHAGSHNEVIAGCGVACWLGTLPLQLQTGYCVHAFY